MLFLFQSDLSATIFPYMFPLKLSVIFSVLNAVQLHLQFHFPLHIPPTLHFHYCGASSFHSILLVFSQIPEAKAGKQVMLTLHICIFQRKSGNVEASPSECSQAFCPHYIWGIFRLKYRPATNWRKPQTMLDKGVFWFC